MRKFLLFACMVLFVLAVPLYALDPSDSPNVAVTDAKQNSSNVFTGATNDFYFAGALDDPSPPTVTQGATTGGSCTSARTYRLYIAYLNASGETDLSFQSVEFTPASGTTNLLTVTRPFIHPSNLYKVSTWSAWFSTDTDHTVIYACGSGGVKENVAAATTTATCYCSTTTNAQEPVSNTTANTYVFRVRSGADYNDVAFANGVKLMLEGTGGDTYMKRDADTGCWQEWKDGALAWQHCTNYAVPPDCASSSPTLPFGGMCKDQTNKRIIMNMGDGPVYLTGSQL